MKYTLNLSLFETIMAEQETEPEQVAQVESNQISAWKIAGFIVVVIVALVALVKLNHANEEIAELTQQTSQMQSDIRTLKSDVVVLSKWCDELKKDLINWTISIDKAFGMMDKTVQSCNDKTNLLMSDYLSRTKK